jgi:hypothetical protein
MGLRLEPFAMLGGIQGISSLGERKIPRVGTIGGRILAVHGY